jgi:hypothetical protein
LVTLVKIALALWILRLSLSARLLLNFTMTLAACPGASVPLLGRAFTHFFVVAALHNKVSLPVFVSV